MMRQTIEELENTIGAQKEISPGQPARIARQSKILVLGADRIQLVQLLFFGQLARRFEMIDDRERDQHRPAPGRHLVNVKKGPTREKNHFHRNCGQIFPRELP
jgi:hypothetical protein